MAEIWQIKQDWDEYLEGHYDVQFFHMQTDDIEIEASTVT